MSVTVVSCVWGDYRKFFATWLAGIEALDPAPYEYRLMEVVVDPACPWRHSQAFYFNEVMSKVETEWAWLHDIDDLAFPDALAGLENVTEDVWLMGYEREGQDLVVPELTNEEYLASTGNPYTGTSCIRTEAFRAVGGFRDLAFQDWDLWRRMARNGATFRSSGRTHFRYQQHGQQRTVTELTADARARNLAEMMEADLAPV